MIAGSVTCSNADLCSYLTDILGTRFPGEFDIKYYVAAMHNWMNAGGSGEPFIQALFDYLKAAVDHITVEVNRTGETVGTPSLGETVFGDLGTIKTDLNNLDTSQTFQNTAYLSPILVRMGNPSPSGQNVLDDLRTIKTGLSGQASTLATLLGDIVAVQTTLSQVALAIVASWPASAGADLVQTIGDFLKALGIGPGQSHLTIGTSAAIVAGALVTKPTGAYGLQLNLSVPGSWGRIDTSPDVYIPAVARLAQFSTWGTAGTPIPIETAFPTFYPLHPACSQVSIELGVGVTGTRAWLLLT
jgi:hypothetical protein